MSGSGYIYSLFKATNGYRSYPGGRGPGSEVDHSPLSSAEVRNAWSYSSTSQYVFLQWYLVKNGDKFTFMFITIYLWRSYEGIMKMSVYWPVFETGTSQIKIQTFTLVR
jgi:hypothetical protein